jgi:hypothetical protein
MSKLKLLQAVLMALLLSSSTGCSSVNLGQIDETPDDREEMAGPGIFADDDGETALKWSSDDKQAASNPEPSNVTAMDEKAEFEQFKIWNELRTRGAETAEYQEFLQWLEYQEFKARQ